MRTEPEVESFDYLPQPNPKLPAVDVDFSKVWRTQIVPIGPPISVSYDLDQNPLLPTTVKLTVKDLFPWPKV
jgi:hypothetical protein